MDMWNDGNAVCTRSSNVRNNSEVLYEMRLQPLHKQKEYIERLDELKRRLRAVHEKREELMSKRKRLEEELRRNEQNSVELERYADKIIKSFELWEKDYRKRMVPIK